MADMTPQERAQHVREQMADLTGAEDDSELIADAIHAAITEERARCEQEIAKLRRRNLNLTQQLERFAERIAAQSELLSHKAQKPNAAS